MRFFLYEFVTGGGFLRDGAEPPESLRREGGAMVAALAEDLAAIDGSEVVLLRDERCGSAPLPCCRTIQVEGAASEEAAFDAWAARSDWTIVIAPESRGHLLDRCRRVERLGGRLLGPNSAIVEIASDKQATADHLAAAGVPAPPGCLVAPGSALPKESSYPAVLKPRFGAGSQGIHWVADPGSARRMLDGMVGDWRLEQFCPGLAASVSFLCGPAGQFPLPPCRQLLSDDGRFTYLGGRLPLPPQQAARAIKLARRAIRSLPGTLGYLGVDLVLGNNPEGREDAVIEINPRMTTSYVGLRAAARPETNLASQMLAVANGHAPRLCFSPREVEFAADGHVQFRNPKHEIRNNS